VKNLLSNVTNWTRFYLLSLDIFVNTFNAFSQLQDVYLIFDYDIRTNVAITIVMGTTQAYPEEWTNCLGFIVIVLRDPFASTWVLFADFDTSTRADITKRHLFDDALGRDYEFLLFDSLCEKVRYQEVWITSSSLYEWPRQNLLWCWPGDIRIAFIRF
jgi:hypothetical protein